MANNFKRVDRSQQFLLPPDMKQWLPADHPVWLLLSVVDRLDFAKFEARYQLGGTGREPFAPSMMVALLVWCISGGERSSRRIELACHENIAARVICGGHAPDHTTISKFLVLHDEDFNSLFEQILKLCHDAGLVQLGILALDGTKIAANASLGSNRQVDRLRQQVEDAVNDTKAQDRADNERLGDNDDGHRVPGPYADPETREPRLDDLVDAATPDTNTSNDTTGNPAAATDDPADVPATANADDLADDLNTTNSCTDLVPTPGTDLVPMPGAGLVPMPGAGLVPMPGAGLVPMPGAGLVPVGGPGGEVVPFSKGGRCRDPQRLERLLVRVDAEAGGRADPKKRVNMVDPDSRVMSTAKGGKIQGFNCQFMASKGQVVVAVKVTNQPNDYGLLGPMTELTLTNLNLAQVGSLPAMILADAGYNSDADLAAAAKHPEIEILVALGKTRTVGDDPGPDPLVAWEQAQAIIDADAAAERHRRAAIFENAATSHTPVYLCAGDLELSQASIYASYRQWRDGGVDNIKVKTAKNPYPKPSEERLRRREMALKLAEPDNKEAYKQRSPIVEGVNARTKTTMEVSRFRRRGLQAVQAEAELAAIANNLSKLVTSIANLCQMSPMNS